MSSRLSSCQEVSPSPHLSSSCDVYNNDSDINQLFTGSLVSGCGCQPLLVYLQFSLQLPGSADGVITQSSVLQQSISQTF